MKISIKKFFSMILVAAIVSCMTMISGGNRVYASDELIEAIDDLLRAANTPESEIQQMDDEFKIFIYENTLSNGNAEYVNVIKEESEEVMARASGYSIPENELKLSVVAFKVSGANQIDVYPSYEWLVPTKPKGKDYFGYSTHSSFSVVPGERSNLIWSKTNKDDAWGFAQAASYTGTSITGYEHSGGDLGTPDFPIYIKGNFYYRVDIDTATPVNKIVLAYVHDTSWGGSVSYGIMYGPLSISITPNSSNVGYQNNVFYLDY